MKQDSANIPALPKIRKKSACQCGNEGLEQDHVLDLIDKNYPALQEQGGVSQDCGKCRNPYSHHAHTKRGDCKFAPENLRNLSDHPEPDPEFEDSTNALDLQQCLYAAVASVEGATTYLHDLQNISETF